MDIGEKVLAAFLILLIIAYVFVNLYFSEERLRKKMKDGNRK